MKSLSCKAIQAYFSDYLDGAVSGLQMQQITHHIEGFADDGSGVRSAGCAACARELAAWRATQEALAMLGPATAPANLGLRLRLAIASECAGYRSRLLDRLWRRWEDAVQPVLLRASAGFAVRRHRAAAERCRRAAGGAGQRRASGSAHRAAPALLQRRAGAYPQRQRCASDRRGTD